MIEANAVIRKIDLDSQEGIIRINDVPHAGTHTCLFQQHTIDSAVEHFRTDKPIIVSGSFQGNDDRGYIFIVSNITFV